MTANSASKLVEDCASDPETVIVMPQLANKFRLAELLANAPKGKWIALSFDEPRFLAAAETFGAAAKLAEQQGELAPVIVPNPEEGLLPTVP